ncbi:MAG: AmmeMemoRadiSam system protein B [Archangiaceae bacterium]|nr:AmmeMemoRadiSam system protein B [Archangiaceae bacterium]
MTTVRPPAVAGSFYPRAPSELQASVSSLLAEPRCTSSARRPRRWWCRTRGYVYSGPIAASAYAQWRHGVASPRPRVVLLGPAHYVGIRGLALPAADALATPLGQVDIDPLALTLGLPRSSEVHAREHSLEVQLPFLQTVFPDFTLIPIAVGQADRAEVARVLDAVWEGSQVVISTDLSHYLPHHRAQQLDARTAESIVEMNADAIDDAQACGNAGLRGFLDVARRRGMRARQLDLRNSGDTSGDHHRVVGYGAFAFFEGSRA